MEETQKIVRELEQKVKDLESRLAVIENKKPFLNAVMVMYNSEADKEIFSTLRTSGFVKHYIKWEKVKGTGSGGMSVIGPVEESEYCIVLIIVPPHLAETLYQQIIDLRNKMVKKTGIAALVFPIDKIG